MTGESKQRGAWTEIRLTTERSKAMIIGLDFIIRATGSCWKILN